MSSRAWSLIHNEKNNCSGQENCHATEKSQAIVTCKEMQVIPVNKVVDMKRNFLKGGAEDEERNLGW
jgi:hypothetical protein